MTLLPLSVCKQTEGRDSKEITTQLVANNRAGMLAEGIFIVLGNEMADSYHVRSLEEAISKWSPEPVSDEGLKTKESTPSQEGPKGKPKEVIPKLKNSKLKPPYIFCKKMYMLKTYLQVHYFISYGSP